MAIAQKQESNIVVGIFYELPDGRIVRTFRWDGRTKEVGYYFDDGEGGRTAPETEVEETWKQRRDLADFPNARDPRLPYSFDLFFDIKYTSELQRALTEGHDDLDEIKKMMKERGITV